MQESTDNKNFNEARRRFFIKEDYVTNPLREPEKKQEGKGFWTERYIQLSHYAQYYVYKHALKTTRKHNCKRILDLGCGVGIMLNTFFLNAGMEVYGIDQPDGVGYCKEHYSDGTFLVEDFENPTHELASYHKTYDLMISADVIEHLLDPHTLLDYMKHYAHTGTRIILSTPDRDKLGVLNNTSPRNLNHIREWNFEEFAALLEDAGLIIEDHFHVFAHKMRPNRDLIHQILWKFKTKDHLRHTQVAVCRVRPS